MIPRPNRLIHGLLVVICLVMAGLTGCANGSVPVDIKFYGSFQATIDGTAYKLEYRLYRPDDEKTHPLIVMTHGRNGLYPRRYPSDVDGYAELCSALSRRGYVVMMLVRRGYGNSEGPDTEIKKLPSQPDWNRQRMF